MTIPRIFEPHAVSVQVDTPWPVYGHDFETDPLYPPIDECMHKSRSGLGYIYCGHSEDEHMPKVTRIDFTCTAAADAECRTYPDCGCEYFGCEHPTVKGQDCYLQGWFDSGFEGTIYEGEPSSDTWTWTPPPVAKTGLIRIIGHEDTMPIWVWA